MNAGPICDYALKSSYITKVIIAGHDQCKMSVKVKCLWLLRSLLIVLIWFVNALPAIHLPVERINGWRRKALPTEDPFEIVSIEGNVNKDLEYWDLEFAAFERQVHL